MFANGEAAGHPTCAQPVAEETGSAPSGSRWTGGPPLSWLVLLCTVGFASAACDTDDATDARTVAHEQFCTDYVTLTCATAERCSCPGGGSTTCESLMRAECSAWAEEPVTGGRMTYDAALGGRCLSDVEAVIDDCSLAGDDWPTACDGMLQGVVAEGGACEGDDECAGALECWNARCVQAPNDGMACVDESVCAVGHYCGADLLCHPYRGPSEPCGEGDWVCGENLLCDSRTNTCEPYVGLDGSCAHSAYACGDDLYCSPASETCRPYPGAGGDCADSGGSCVEGFYCDASSVCQAQLAGGAPCTDGQECLSWSCTDGTCEATTDSDSVCAYGD